MTEPIYYGFRLSHNKWITPDEMADWFTKYCNRIAYCTEIGKTNEKLHYHYYLELKTPNYNTVRTFIAKYFLEKTEISIKDNGYLRAFTKLKLEDVKDGYVSDYIRYMCKPDKVKDKINPIEVRHNFPRKWIVQAMKDEKKYAEELALKVKDKKEMEQGQFKAILERLDKYCQENKIRLKEHGENESIQKRLCQEIIKFFSSKLKKLSRQNVESILTTYLCIRSDAFAASLSRKIVQNMNFER